MSRKVLFSFLGLSNYIPCYYNISGFQSTYTPFVQTAITEYLLQKDINIEVIVFVTKEAEAKNWHDRRIKDNEIVEGLESYFNKIIPKVNVKKVTIPSEQDLESNWELFETIINEIEEKDEIYFDVTHSFRINPLIALIVLNYGRLIKNASIGGLMYGLFEKLGSSSAVDEMPAEERKAPIVDFSKMAELLDWTNGVNQFLETGNAELIKKLTNQERKNIEQTSELNKQDTKILNQMNNISNAMYSVSEHFETVRGNDLPKEIDNLLNKIRALDKVEVNHMRALIPLLKKVSEKLEGYGIDEASKNNFIIEWCVQHGLIQQGFTFLQENIITAICRYCQIDEKEKNNREAVSSMMNVYYLPVGKWKGSKEKIDLMKQTYVNTTKYKEYFGYYQGLTDYRNDINHAQSRKNSIKSTKFKEKLKELGEKYTPFFKEIYAEIENRR